MSLHCRSWLSPNLPFNLTPLARARPLPEHEGWATPQTLIAFGRCAGHKGDEVRNGESCHEADSVEGGTYSD